MDGRTTPLYPTPLQGGKKDCFKNHDNYSDQEIILRDEYIPFFESVNTFDNRYCFGTVDDNKIVNEVRISIIKVKQCQGREENVLFILK